MFRLVGRTSRRLVTDCPCLLDVTRRRRPEPQRGAARRTSRRLVAAQAGRGRTSRPPQAGWTHVATPRHGLPTPAGRAESSSSGASETGCYGRTSRRLVAALAGRGRTSRPLVAAHAGWTHVATPRHGMLRLVGRASRRLVTPGRLRGLAATSWRLAVPAEDSRVPLLRVRKAGCVR